MRLAVCLLALITACASPGGEVTLTVFAASSLAPAFDEIAERFEEQHDGVDVVVSYAGSQALAAQIVQGASPDVFASADVDQMERALDATPPDHGPAVFAENRLVIAVAPGNPKGIDSLDDLARDDLVVVLGADEVPVGEYSRAALEGGGVEPNVASLEPNVGLVLSKIRLGEADAGIVYASDVVRAGGEVEGVEFPSTITAAYPVAGWGEGPAREFLDYLASDEAGQILRAAGFRP